MSRSVNIAELRRGLSRYLKRVRRGEEILIRDRNVPVAKLVPLEGGDLAPELLQLAAEGVVGLPREKMDWNAFFATPAPRVPLAKLLAALDWVRGED